eukprot:2906281-Pleurochrysis_carterae.AAC.1
MLLFDTFCPITSFFLAALVSQLCSLHAQNSADTKKLFARDPRPQIRVSPPRRLSFDESAMRRTTQVAPEKDTDLSSPEFLDTLSSWLLRHQPISLAINGKAPDADAANSVPDHYFVARRLFEQTALCVYTVGDAEAPALTAQARAG